MARDALTYLIFAAVGIFGSLSNSTAEAAFSITHSGSTDPATEGFPNNQTFGAASTAGPLANDMGHAAWSIAGTGQNSQFIYSSGMLSAAQLADIADGGFVLTMQARAVQGSAPVYSGIQPIVIGGTHLDANARRYEMALGLDSNGDTVVVLPNSIDAGGPGGSIRAPGSSYTLIGSGSSYHTYQLIFNPGTLLADLFVDGVQRIQGYPGHTSFVADRGLVWAANSGGQVNFALVRVASPIPEPSALVLAAVAMAVALLWRR